MTTTLLVDTSSLTYRAFFALPTSITGEDGAPVNAVRGYLDMVAGGTLLGRVAEPSEIVGPVLYLASDASSFVTADDISVSGGMMK